MDIYPDRLGRHLAKGPLAPVWLVAGEEPLVLEEAADSIRTAARKAGHSDRQIHHLGGKGEDWHEALAGADAMSLFADRTLLDIRFTGSPGLEGGKALAAWVADPPDDALLLLTCDKAPGRDMKKTKWFKAVAGAGVVVPVWPVGLDALPKWLADRCRSRDVSLDDGARQALIERVEGNLLAAAQEVERLRLLGDGRPWTAERLLAATEDSSRYSPFTLVEEALAGNSRRVTRILYALRMEGGSPMGAVMLLGNEVRKLLAMAAEVRSGAAVDAVVARNGVFKNRQPATAAALRRLKPAVLAGLLDDLAAVDLAIKGGLALDPWLELGRICLRLAGDISLPGPRLHRQALQVASQPEHRLP